MSKALELAKECNRVHIEDEEFFAFAERFYRLAQAQALRDAARMWSIYGTITTDHSSETTEVCRSDNLLSQADSLVNQK